MGTLRPGIAALLLATRLAAQSGQLIPPAGGSTAAARDTLRQAEQRLSRTAFEQGLAAALSAALAADAVLLLEGAPIVQGRDAAARLSAAQPALEEVRVSWEPFRLLLSHDGTLGVSFGGTVVQRGEYPPSVGRYASVWRRSAAGGWELVAHLQNGPLAELDIVLPAGLGSARPAPIPPPSDAFTEADLAFARLAAEQGAPAAFARYAAPDGLTLAATGELNIGPEAVRARLLEGRAATAHWRWWPVVTFAARSGDLGVTIGEAEIRLRDDPAGPFYSKYLSVWQRQPDGTLKFVFDGGSARPVGR